VLRPFTVVTLPTITGVRRAGSVLTASAGTWRPAPTKVTFGWKRNGVAIAGATGRSYRLADRDTGARITITVTATRAGYVPKAADRTTSVIGKRPVIVLDPGHAPVRHSIDKKTRLDVSEYENEPEMRDVYNVALRVRKQLQHDGYRVVMTKRTLTSRVSLAKRAKIANEAHADLAVSIHDQAGANGGITYRAGNNIVYYQSVGGYRTNVNGKRIVFKNTRVAARSKHYGRVFKKARAAVQHTSVRLQGGVDYNLGSRGLAAGDMWMVQLLSKVPWIYNEAGGNSRGHVGLVTADRANYAAALVRSIETSVPLTRAG
jgi:N-acetylmuramoyl-L-alanine amidase